MKMIKFTAGNQPKIETAIKAVEGRATLRTVPMRDLVCDVFSAEEKLKSLGIPKKHWDGVRIISEESFTLPNSYKYVADSTTVEILWSGGCWRFVSAFRGNCGKRGGTRLILSDTARANQPAAFWL